MPKLRSEVTDRQSKKNVNTIKKINKKHNSSTFNFIKIEIYKFNNVFEKVEKEI
jgi:hypothetical protein